MDELQSGPLMGKSLTGRRFAVELSLKYGYAYMWDNEMKINEFVSGTILDGYFLSYHFRWYVKCHITPHGLRVMALRSWRTLICRLEAPKGQRSQRACKEEIII